jgi:hypothetical protein
MAMTISGAEEAWFISANDEVVGLHADKMMMELSSKPINKRLIRHILGILLDYLDGMQANTKLQINFTI